MPQSAAKKQVASTAVHSFNIPHGMATGTGVGTIRRFLNSVGAIVMTFGFVGVFSPVEVKRNESERFGRAVEAAETALGPCSSPTIENRITWSFGIGAFGRRVRGTIGRLIGFGFTIRRVRFDSPARHCKTTMFT